MRPKCKLPSCGREARHGGRYCTKACAQVARKEWLRVRSRHRRRGGGPDDPRLGPDIPLDGISEPERRRRLYARIVEVAKTGVPFWALEERFGPAVWSALPKTGIRNGRDPLPYGPPL